MSDSLVIAGQIELIGPPGGVDSTLPGCAGVRFVLDIQYDLGVGQPLVSLLSELVVDGEQPQGERTGNRTLAIPISILSQDRDTLALARESLLKIVNAKDWELTWTRDGGQPFVIQCFRAQPSTILYSLNAEQQNVAQLVLNGSAMPFGKSDMPDVLSFYSPTQGQPPAAIPYSVDLFGAVTTTGWTRSTCHIEGSYSCRRDVDGWRSRPNSRDQDAYIANAFYTNSFAPVDISALTAITCRAGFVDPSYNRWWGRNSNTMVSFTLTFVDSSGNRLVIGSSHKCYLGSDVTQPIWKKLSLPIPASDEFDFTSVVSYSILLNNHSDGSLRNCIPFLDSLWAVGTTTLAVQTTRGAIYNLNGIKGSAHAPLRMTVQQAPTLAPTPVTLTGSGNWPCPVGITRAQVISIGAGGPGASIAAMVGATPTPIVFAGSSFASTGAGQASSLVVPVPAGTTSPDYMIMTVTVGYGGSGGFPVCPAGWVQLSPNGSGMGVFGKWASSSEPVTYTVNLSLSCYATAEIMTYGGSINQTTPVKAFAYLYSGDANSLVLAQPSGVAATDLVVCSGSYYTDNTWASIPSLTHSGGSWTDRIASFGTSAPNSGYGHSQYPYDWTNVASMVFDHTGITGNPTISGNHQGYFFGAFVVLQMSSNTTGGGSGGAGEAAVENNVQLTPLISYPYVAPPAPAPGTLAIPDTTFAADNVTIRAHAGTAAVGQQGGLAGNGSNNAIKFRGGNGANATSVGMGGASAASASQAGNSATGVLGAAAVGTSGAGGRGGIGPNGAGQPGGAPGAGGGGATFASGAAQPGGYGGAARILINYYNATLPTFKTAILHRPSSQAPEFLVPVVVLSGGGAPGLTTPIPDPMTGVHARFNGTYSVMLAASSWANSSTSRLVQVSVIENDNDAGLHTSISTCMRNITPSTDVPGYATGGLINVGELTLPSRDIGPDNTAMSYSVKVDSGQSGDRFLDVIFIDTMGQTVYVNTASTWYNQLFIDEAPTDRDFGRVLGTATDRPQAVSVLADAYPAGPPLYVNPGDNMLLGYCLEGAPALIASYNARWWIDRAD